MKRKEIINIFRRFFGSQQEDSENQNLTFPCILKTTILDTDLRFEALVKEDISRIYDFDGEKDYFEKLAHCLRPDDNFLDIGAFTGQVSCLAAKICRSVLAVEPDPEFCNRIRKNLRLNNLENVQIAECGLADEEGELLLNTSGGTGWAPSFLNKGLNQNIPVTIKKIDTIVEEYDFQPNVLKMDIEGFEYKALLGGELTFSNPILRSVFIEFHPAFMIQADADVAEVISFLGQFGFKFAQFEPRKNEISAIAHRIY